MKENIVKRIIDRLFGPSKAERDAVAKLDAKLEKRRPKAKRALVGAASVLALLGIWTGGCAAPQAEQGRSAQGGSTGQQPVVVNNIVFHGNVKTDSVTTGTAAPSAASEATSKQDAKADVPVTVDASGVVPAVGAKAEAVKAAAAVAEKVAEPKPAPVEPPK